MEVMKTLIVVPAAQRQKVTEHMPDCLYCSCFVFDNVYNGKSMDALHLTAPAQRQKLTEHMPDSCFVCDNVYNELHISA